MVEQIRIYWSEDKWCSSLHPIYDFIRGLVAHSSIKWTKINIFVRKVSFVYQNGNVDACATVTGLANFGFTPLLWHPQGPQGCLEKQNYPLSSNLVVWSAKIGPKTKKVQKPSEIS